jgi:hypothetical protein
VRGQIACAVRRAGAGNGATLLGPLRVAGRCAEMAAQRAGREPSHRASTRPKYEFGTPQEEREFIVTHFRRDVEGFVALERGEWSQACAFALDNEQYVIRFAEHFVDFPNDKVMAAYSSERLPIPAVREVGETVSGYFAVSKRAPSVALDTLNEAGMRAALPAILDAIEACAGLDTSRGRGYGPWDQEQHAPYDSWSASLLAIAQEHHRAPWQGLLPDHRLEPKASAGWGTDGPVPHLPVIFNTGAGCS